MNASVQIEVEGGEKDLRHTSVCEVALLAKRAISVEKPVLAQTDLVEGIRRLCLALFRKWGRSTSRIVNMRGLEGRDSWALVRHLLPMTVFTKRAVHAKTLRIKYTLRFILISHMLQRAILYSALLSVFAGRHLTFIKAV